jgi:hypothetical protein
MAPDEDRTDKSAPLMPSSSPEPALQPKRTGLIVVVAALLLLLVAAAAGAMVLTPLARTLFGADKRSVAPGIAESARTKARIETAVGLMEVLRINDLAKVKPYLSDVAQNAITAEQWSEVASIAIASGVPTATYSPIRWADATTATVDYDIDSATGTMTFAPNSAKPNVVTMTDDGSDGQLVYDIELAPVGSGWRVLALTPMAETYPLDETFVKGLLDTTPAP